MLGDVVSGLLGPEGRGEARIFQEPLEVLQAELSGSLGDDRVERFVVDQCRVLRRRDVRMSEQSNENEHWDMIHRRKILRAFPEKICSRSASEMSIASTAASVAR